MALTNFQPAMPGQTLSYPGLFPVFPNTPVPVLTNGSFSRTEETSMAGRTVGNVQSENETISANQGASSLDLQYLESQIELLLKLLRVSNDERLEKHFVSYMERTTSKNPLPFPKGVPFTPSPMDELFWNNSLMSDENGRNESLSEAGNWWVKSDFRDYIWPLIPLLICILISIVGNILVCLAVWRDKKLQSMTNYFLFSLAVADLGVAAFVMPLALVNNFAGSWVLGPIMCNLWTTMDVTFCTSSILHLCTIQLDRYMAIRVPVRYGEMNRSKKWATVKMFSVWFLSSCVGGTLFTLSLITQANSYRRFETVYVCAIFSEHIMLYGSLAAFYIPFFTMMVLYSLTVYALRQRSLKNKKHAPKIANGGLAGRGTLNGPSAARAKLYIALKTKRSKNTTKASTLEVGGEIELCPESSSPQPTANANHLQSSAAPAANHASSSKARLLSSSNSSSANRGALSTSTALANAQKRKRDQKENERRAQMVLLIVFVSFVLLWFPFFAINIVTPICKSCVEKYIDPKWIEFTTWMGYMSAMLNPIIYTIFNRLFRDAFVDIILCRNPNHRRLHNVINRGRNK